MGAESPTTDWALLYVIEFSDGGEPEMRLMHRGTEEECEKLSRLLPAVSYSGSRPVTKARLEWGRIGA